MRVYLLLSDASISEMSLSGWSVGKVKDTWSLPVVAPVPSVASRCSSDSVMELSVPYE